MTSRLYLDNAATSFPKPSVVLEAMSRYMTHEGASPGRGAYREAIDAGAALETCRDRINELIGGAAPNHVIFTLNTTDALHLAIGGVIAGARRRGAPLHVVTTWLDHNSILRPFSALEADGVDVTRVPCDPETGIVDPADVEAALRPETTLVATVHGSNVTGRVQPVGAIGAMCRERDIPFLVDAAQTLGHRPVDVDALAIDLLAFPGHKGLLGPLGTGGLYIRPGLESRVLPVRTGGTGSASEQDVQPDVMPDRYEAGSHNAVGLIGLGAAVGWLLERGIDTLWAEEQELIERMDTALAAIKGLRVLGGRGGDRCSVFSVTLDGIDPEALAAILEDQFSILTRAGLHCAPRAHATMGTHESGGAVRLSLGPFVTMADVDRATTALARIAHDVYAGAHP